MGLFDKIKGFIGDPEEEDDLDMEMDDEMDFVSKNEDSTEAFIRQHRYHQAEQQGRQHPCHSPAAGGAGQAGAF